MANPLAKYAPTVDNPLSKYVSKDETNPLAKYATPRVDNPLAKYVIPTRVQPKDFFGRAKEAITQPFKVAIEEYRDPKSILNTLIRGKLTKFGEKRGVPITEENVEWEKALEGLKQDQLAIQNNPVTQAFIGFSEARTFGLTKLVGTLPEAEGEGGQIARQIGSLVGLWGAVKTMGEALPGTGLPGYKPTKWMGVLAKRMLTGALRLGGYNILSYQGGKNLAEEVRLKTQAGVGGATTGAIFGAIGTIGGDKFGKLIQKFVNTKNPAVLDGIKTAGEMLGFITRLGANYAIVSHQDTRRFIRGEESLPGLMYSYGLATMFSLSHNPLQVEARHNKMVLADIRRQKMIERTIKLDTPILNRVITKLGEFDKVPAHIKWAYIMKATNGKIKPTWQNAGAMDAIFEQTLRVYDPKTHDKLDTVRVIKEGVEAEVIKQMGEIDRTKTIGTAQAGFEIEKVQQKAQFTEKQLRDIKDWRRDIIQLTAELRKTQDPAEQKVIRGAIARIQKDYIEPIVKAKGKIKPPKYKSKGIEIIEIESEGFGGKRKAPKASIELAAVGEEEYAGNISGNIKKGGILELWDLEVDPSRRKLGIGTDLVKNIVKIAHNKMGGQLKEITAFDTTKFSIPLFNKFGATFIDPLTGKVLSYGQALDAKAAKKKVAMRMPVSAIVQEVKKIPQFTVTTRRGDVRDKTTVTGDVSDAKQMTSPADVYTEVFHKNQRVGWGKGQLMGNELHISDINAKGTEGYGIGSRSMRKLIQASKKANPTLNKVNGIVGDTKIADMALGFGAKFSEQNTETGQWLPIGHQRARSMVGSSPVKFEIDLNSAEFAISKVGKEMPYMAGMPVKLAREEMNLRYEMATGKDWGELVKLAKSMKDVFRSKSDQALRTKLETYFKEYFHIKNTGNLTREQIGEAKEFMNKYGNSEGRLPDISQRRDVVTLDVAAWMNKRGNAIDYVQSARMPLRPIYDIYKPAYINYMMAREAKLEKLRAMYGGRVKPGSKLDQQLGMYAERKIKLEEIPEKYRSIAQAREQFYNQYADKLLELGLIKRAVVFDKQGNRRPYYHRIFDHVISDRLFKSGFALEDFWLPGDLPLAGPLHPRYGAKGYKYSAMESDRRYVYGVEKYLNLYEANKAAIKIADQLRDKTRRHMANTYIRYMRGQPTSTDVIIKEQIQNLAMWTGEWMEKVGLDKQGKKLKEWRAPDYPISRGASPLARFYYWRFIGMAFDTSLKNALQFHHAIPRYGADNVTRAMYAQFTPEGKSLIKESGILSEGIRRGGHFVEESAVSRRLSNIEKASYWMWTMADRNNRQIAGLSGYYWARGQGRSHQQAVEAMKQASHETQYGYNKADSLLMDMVTPLSRFLLFKKWPLSKVEMLRSWAKDGHKDAIMNLALTEYFMFRSAQGLGIDLGNHFSSIWNLAFRGTTTFWDMVPAIQDLKDIYMIFQPGSEGNKARDKMIRTVRAFGNRWAGKGIDVWQAWQDDYKVRDLSHIRITSPDDLKDLYSIGTYKEGKLKYQATSKELITSLFYRPLETTKRYQKMRDMLDLRQEIVDIKQDIIRAYIGGDQERANKLQLKLKDKYGDNYVDTYGKLPTSVNRDDIIQYIRDRETEQIEKVRKGMPGESVVRPGYKVKDTNRDEFIRALRGY